MVGQADCSLNIIRLLSETRHLEQCPNDLFRCSNTPQHYGRLPYVLHACRNICRWQLSQARVAATVSLECKERHSEPTSDSYLLLFPIIVTITIN